MDFTKARIHLFTPQEEKENTQSLNEWGFPECNPIFPCYICHRIKWRKYAMPKGFFKESIQKYYFKRYAPEVLE